MDGDKGRVWGLRPTALRVSAATVRLACTVCGHFAVIARAERAHWADMPCLSARCDGRYGDPGAGDAVDYFGQLYNQGQVHRVFAEEHTGLLARGQREEVEAQFKAGEDERKPWFANLLSCTPTLEIARLYAGRLHGHHFPGQPARRDLGAG